jgi:hypothetical protein
VSEHPKTICGDLHHLPAALAPLVALPNWVLWRWEKAGDNWTKVPYQPSRKKAKNNDPKTWSTYEKVVSLVGKFGFHGIGFCLLGSGLAAFDIDDCRDPDTGAVNPWAQEQVVRAGSYAEVTVSGTGLRIIGLGVGPRVHRKQAVGGDITLETYRQAERYIVITGNPLPGSDRDIVNIDAHIDETVAELDARNKKTEPSRPGTPDDGGHHARQSEEEDRLERVIRDGESGEWKGDHSRAVLFVACEMMRRRYVDSAIRSALLDRGNRISDHVLRQTNPRRYVERQIARARELVPRARAPSAKTSVIVRASEVPMRAKHWLWLGHLLRGAQELLTGIPGLGKSQVQCSYIARVTAGLPWPNGDPGMAPANVIMITAEDALDQEVIPRLVAAGADCNRVHIVKAIKIDDGTSRQFLLAEDLDQLARDVTRIGDVGLVTLDPITAYMGGRIDSHKTTQVRSQLGPLKDFAETYDVAVSTVTHPAKNAGQRAIDHFIGSQAFIAAGRIGHVCAEEMREDDSTEQMVPTGRILFAHAKHYPSAKMPTLAYRQGVLTVGIDERSREPIEAPHVVWEEAPVNISPDEAVGMRDKKTDGSQSKVREFLKGILAGGKPVAQKYIAEEGKERHGFTEKQLRTAKEKMGIVSDKTLDGWTWALPPRPRG